MHVRTDGQQAACAQRKASGCVCIRTNAQPQHNHSTHTRQCQRTFLKPMSLAYSRKQRRQIIIAYLRITPATQCNSNVSLQATTARLAPAYSACAHIHTHVHPEHATAADPLHNGTRRGTRLHRRQSNHPNVPRRPAHTRQQREPEPYFLGWVFMRFGMLTAQRHGSAHRRHEKGMSTTKTLRRIDARAA